MSNDFTKEELEELLGWGQELCNEHDIEWLPEEQALSKKLQSLIDNYSQQGVSSANHNEIQGPADTNR